MKTMLVGILALGMATLAAGQYSQSGNTSAEEKAVAALDDQGRQSALKNDTAFLEKHLASTYMGISPMGETITRDEDIASWKRGDFKLTAIDERDRKVQIYGNTAVVTAIADVRGTRSGQDISGTYRRSSVYVKQNGEWQQVLFQLTKVQSTPQQTATEQSSTQQSTQQ